VNPVRADGALEKTNSFAANVGTTAVVISVPNDTTVEVTVNQVDAKLDTEPHP
jgi:hypothetical protein